MRSPHWLFPSVYESRTQEEVVGRFLPCPRVNLNFLGFLFDAAVLGEDSFSTKLIAKLLF